MAALTLNKKTGITIAVVAAAAVLAFGIIHYIETTVENSLRELVNTQGKPYQAKVGKISYSLIKNRLELTDITGRYQEDSQEYHVAIKQIEVLNPNRSFESILTDPAITAISPLADEIRVIDYSVTSGANTRVNVAAYIISKLETNPVKLRAGLEDMSKKGFSTRLTLAFNTAAVQATSLDAFSREPLDDSGSKFMTVGVTCDTALVKNMREGAFETMQLNNFLIRIDGNNALLVKQIRADNCAVPDEATLTKLTGLAGKHPTTAAEDEETLALVGQLFTGTKPLLEKLGFSDVVMYDFTAPAVPEVGRIAELRFANPLTKPFTFRVEMEHLLLPTSIFPEAKEIEAFGLKELDISTALGIAGPKPDDVYDVVLSMTVAQMGTLLLDVTPVLSSATLAALSDDVTNEADNVPLARMELSFKDQGFMGKAARMASQRTGMPPALMIKWAGQLLQAQLAASGEQDPQAQKIMDDMLLFLEKPGNASIRFNPPQPMSLEESAEKILQNGYMTFSVAPGPKTLTQLMEEENKLDAPKTGAPAPAPGTTANPAK